VTALVSTSGTVVERYTYTPYGKVTFRAPDWSERASSAYANEVLFTGHQLDTETGLYYGGWRYYHPTLGCWISRDGAVDRAEWVSQTVWVSKVAAPYSAGRVSTAFYAPLASVDYAPSACDVPEYLDGLSLYQAQGSEPIGHVDPYGLKKCKWTGRIDAETGGVVANLIATLTVSAHGKDDEGCDYGIRAEGERVLPVAGATVGAGYFIIGAKITDHEATCEWPVKDGDSGQVIIIGVGFSVGIGGWSIPINLAYASARAGELKATGGPFSISGQNWFVGGGGLAVTLKVTHRSGPTPSK